MSVGKNIQIYRKNLGMSQEELGQKLHVSRQTVSLWEKEQTLPTIDNLIRLKEIFGVSVDEMLGFENAEEAEEENKKSEPKEMYTLRFEKEEIKELSKAQMNPIYKKFAVMVSLNVIILMIAFSNSNETAAFFLLFFVANLISGILSIRKSKKLVDKAFCRISNSGYEYRLFDDCMTADVFRNNEKAVQYRFGYTDLEKVFHQGKWLVIQVSGQIFYLRKKDLQENSLLNAFVYKLIVKSEKKQKLPAKYKVVSIALFVASLLSIIAGIATAGMLSTFPESMWVFFLFVPIPVASVIFGLLISKKGYKCVKNIVVGIIMTIMLCIYGSFSFAFGDIYDHSDAFVVEVEQTLKVDIPAPQTINTMDWTKGSQSVPRGYMYYTSNVYFDDNAVSDFENQLATDERWLSVLPNNLVGISSPADDYDSYDYILIYNTYTHQFNELPGRSGTYRFVSVAYNLEDNSMKIAEYDIDYAE